MNVPSNNGDQMRKKDIEEKPKSRPTSQSEGLEEKARSSSLADLVAASRSRSDTSSAANGASTSNHTSSGGGHSGSSGSGGVSGRSSSRSSGGGSTGTGGYTQRRSPYGHAGKKFPRTNSNSSANGNVSEMSETVTRSSGSNGSGRPRVTGGRSSNRGGSNAVIDSNGPAGKIRGTAHQLHDRYTHFAQDSKSDGDRINTERLRQYAEHYHRMTHGFD